MDRQGTHVMILAVYIVFMHVYSMLYTLFETKNKEKAQRKNSCLTFEFAGKYGFEPSTNNIVNAMHFSHVALWTNKGPDGLTSSTE